MGSLRSLAALPGAVVELRQRQTENMARGQNSRTRAALQWMMDTRLTPGNHVLAIDMASCIRCGNCVTACEQTHEDGLSRFFWDRLRGNEELMAHVGISSSCQHCQDAPCMRVCPTVAIERDLTTGGVAIDYVKCPCPSTAVYECNLVGRELREFEERGRISATHSVSHFRLQDVSAEIGSVQALAGHVPAQVNLPPREFGECPRLPPGAEPV